MLEEGWKTLNEDQQASRQKEVDEGAAKISSGHAAMSTQEDCVGLVVCRPRGRFSAVLRTGPGLRMRTGTTQPEGDEHCLSAYTFVMYHHPSLQRQSCEAVQSLLHLRSICAIYKSV
jgi:hypothetical protein